MKYNKPISSIMTTSPITVSEENSLNEIEAIFRKYPFHHLPVTGKGNKVLGIISQADLLSFMKKLSYQTTGKYYSNKSKQASTAKDIMTSQPIVLDPDDTVGLAADIFLANKFHAVPVVEDDELIGIITSHDLLQYAYKEDTIEGISS